MHSERAPEGAVAAERPDHHVEVSVSTIAGFFPTEGFNRVPAHQKVEVELEKAKIELKIKDTAGWVATVIAPSGKRVIDAAKTYTENELSGEVGIDWGPHVEVSVSTTAGFFPTEGFNRVPAHQKVEVELEKAKIELKIKDTAGWVATVIAPSGKRVIDAAKTYSENELSGEVEIDWGPSEGGGG